MSGKRFIYIAVIVALALAAGVFVPSGGSQATSFRPIAGPVYLSSEALGAHADIEIPFTIDAPDANFGTYVTSLNSPQFIQSSVTLGKTVGYLLAPTVRLALLSQGCLTYVTVNFRLVDASTDNSPGNLAQPIGPAISPVLNFTQDDGDINNDGTVDDPTRAANGIDDGAEWYPEFLNTMFNNKTPAQRYFGWQQVPNTSARVIIQIVMFGPGDLHNLPAIPSSDLLTAAQGAPSMVILNDPTAVPPQAIEDFCTPLVTQTILCGMTDSDPDNPMSVYPDCDVGAGSEVRGTNPLVAGTYDLRTFTLSQRDADNDGIENWMDPCPHNVDTWDPRATTEANKAAGKDNDADNIPNTCDPEFDEPGQLDYLDQDEDGWTNRVDNCPLVANVVPNPIKNQGQLDFDISDGSAVPDGGPPVDFIGPECDTPLGHEIIPDGHYHAALTMYRMCLGGGTDADNDGVCATYPGENDGTADTDGDGILDRQDNCIGRANPNPAGLTQMSPDILGDGQVLIDDVTYVAGKFGRETGEAGYRASAEVASQDGSILIDDVTAVAGAFGRWC